jgi:large subunit ribosomal protein L17
MRHGKRFNHLGRTAPHRKAMLSNMASSLILHKRISTTVAKAKALRQYVEPLITKSKTDSTHNRRVVFSYLQDKDSVRELFDDVSEKVGQRPGGYTRIIKTSSRLGDNADMCIMELVDYNSLMLEEKETKKTKTRRGRRRKKSDDSQKEASANVVAAESEEVAVEVTEKDQDEVVAEEVVQEAEADVKSEIIEGAEAKQKDEEKAEKKEDVQPENKAEVTAVQKEEEEAGEKEDGVGGDDEGSDKTKKE